MFFNTAFIFTYNKYKIKLNMLLVSLDVIYIRYNKQLIVSIERNLIENIV